MSIPVLNPLGPVHQNNGALVAPDNCIEVLPHDSCEGMLTAIVGNVKSEVITSVSFALHPFDPVDTMVYVPALFTIIPVVPANVAIAVQFL